MWIKINNRTPCVCCKLQGWSLHDYSEFSHISSRNGQCNNNLEDTHGTLRPGDAQHTHITHVPPHLALRGKGVVGAAAIMLMPM